MADMSGRLHFIWDHSDGLDEPWRCWCGVDHPDDNGLTGVAKYISRDDPGWVSITDPRAEAALDDLYAEAWLSPVPPEPPDLADDDWATVEAFIHGNGYKVVSLSDGSRSAIPMKSEDSLAALARLRARDQARTDALIEAAWSYRQKADECGLATMEGVYRMAADTLTRIARGDTT